jgi:hypothetical protein
LQLLKALIPVVSGVVVLTHALGPEAALVYEHHHSLVSNNRLCSIIKRQIPQLRMARYFPEEDMQMTSRQVKESSAL